MPEQNTTPPEPPRLVRRRANRHSTLKTGRTLSARRERLETSDERLATREHLKRQKRARFIITIIGFSIIIAMVVGLGILLFSHKADDDTPSTVATPTIVYQPTIEVIEEDSGGSVTSRMRQYIGQAEVDFRELGLIPIKAVIPTGAIREVDFYLDGHSGFIKMILDRDTAVSVEDAYRMIRYLEEGQGITDYQYIDVRLPGQAYWK